MRADDRVEGGNASEIFEIDHNRRMLRVGLLERNLLNAEERAIRDSEDRAGDKCRPPGGIGAKERREHHEDRHEVGDFDSLAEPGEQRTLGSYDFAIAALVFVFGHSGTV